MVEHGLPKRTTSDTDTDFESNNFNSINDRLQISTTSPQPQKAHESNNKYTDFPRFKKYPENDHRMEDNSRFP